jgi:CDP-diacylglycerol--serine O-phosphatidyltransferase
LLDLFNRNIANTVTLINLTLGALSLTCTLRGNYRLAAALIMLAVLMDAMDGRLARRLDTASELGKQLDSLCDLVSFGVAPSLLIYDQVFIRDMIPLGIVLFLLFILCSAFRLARFNVMQVPYFVGVPITLAGALMALLSLLADQIPGIIVGILTLVLALLMISTIRVKKL